MSTKSPSLHYLTLCETGIKRRGLQLLGTDDPLWKKQNRAFGIQAEQGIWDIGAPMSSRVEMPFEKSRFRVRYERGLYPFQIDYSGNISTQKVFWLSDIEQYDVGDLMKDTLEAQTDNPHWSNVGHLVFKDLLKHLSPTKLMTALPAFSIEFRKVMHRNNEETCRRLLKMLKELALVVTSLGPELACYTHELFNLSYQWLLRHNEVGDRIAYEQRKGTHLNDLNDELHAIFEMISGPEMIHAIAGMKLANPTYKLPEKSIGQPHSLS
ncbi:hypothetical protein Aperf_G00000003154 [Anoplocephala perfoliata]